MVVELLDVSGSVVLHGAEDRCPHAIVHNFLGPRLVRRLLRHVDRERAKFLPALVYRQQVCGAVEDANVRNCAVLFPIKPFQKVIEPRILQVLRLALAKLGLFEREAVVTEFEFCAYGDGGLFKAHHDVMPKGEPRIASCVYYFFHEPAGFGGGELRLYPWPQVSAGNAPKRPWVDVVPTRDSLVIFPSALRHEVRPVTSASREWGDQRFTINCWAYRRMPKETVPPAGQANV